MKLGTKVLCVFAHPDDESFGPGGTIYTWAKSGALIHLLSATRGENGSNHTRKETARVRSQELRKAATILGIDRVSYLGFTDGTISNRDLQILMNKIRRYVERFRPDIMMTFNLNGVSGHIDHMAVASAVTKVFDETSHVKQLYYYTSSRSFSNKMKHYFIHFPEGVDPEKADKTIDINAVYDKKIEAMKAHASQMDDVEDIVRLEKDVPKHEHFMVRTRDSAS